VLEEPPIIPPCVSVPVGRVKLTKDALTTEITPVKSWAIVSVAVAVIDVELP
jgi:hypothetical protein